MANRHQSMWKELSLGGRLKEYDEHTVLIRCSLLFSFNCGWKFAQNLEKLNEPDELNSCGCKSCVLNQYSIKGWVL